MIGRVKDSALLPYAPADVMTGRRRLCARVRLEGKLLGSAQLQGAQCIQVFYLTCYVRLSAEASAATCEVPWRSIVFAVASGPVAL